jgi:phosphoenolpyruvate synthase/pyruvate phosphate dikinase
MYNQLSPLGISIPNGFALTADVYRLFRKENNIEVVLSQLLLSLDSENYSNLTEIEKKLENTFYRLNCLQTLKGNSYSLPIALRTKRD